MKDPNEAWVVARAQEYFGELERLLLDLGYVRSKFRRAMKTVARQYRRDVRGVRLVLYPKIKPPNPEVTALYWGQLCRLPKLKHGARKSPKFRRWIRHLRGELTRHRIYFAGALDFKTKIWEFDRRAKLLNRPNVLLTWAMVAIEKSMLSRGRRRAWESGDLESPAPLTSLDLSEPCRRALGAVWFFLLRMASVEAELLRMVHRYRENPAHPDFRLAHKRGKAFRYGAVYWNYRGSR
ncbi:MAG TPA: hypothetical protein VG457_15830, partial [Planctomycetota bacterium]|nr:hypothetical protein [Planctomycetota bacterium]